MNKKKRFSVLKRFGFQCVYCGRKPPEIVLEVDHREAKVVGGGEEDNLVASCRDCNRGKGATSDQDDDGIVIVFGSDGHIDHKRSLRLSGLWSSTPKELRHRLTEPIQVPIEVLLLDVLDAERAMKRIVGALQAAKERVFRTQSHEWFTKSE